MTQKCLNKSGREQFERWQNKGIAVELFNLTITTLCACLMIGFLSGCVKDDGVDDNQEHAPLETGTEYGTEGDTSSTEMEDSSNDGISSENETETYAETDDTDPYAETENLIDSGDSGVPEEDECPNDPHKTLPGVCGCGKSDADSDNDSVPNCIDVCPSDPEKTELGVCGCGVPETDGDGDGTPDCVDLCPDAPDNPYVDLCGCDIPSADSDDDGTPDCADNCPGDPDKIDPGFPDHQRANR